MKDKKLTVNNQGGFKKGKSDQSGSPFPKMADLVNKGSQWVFVIFVWFVLVFCFLALSEHLRRQADEVQPRLMDSEADRKLPELFSKDCDQWHKMHTRTTSGVYQGPILVLICNFQ